MNTLKPYLWAAAVALLLAGIGLVWWNGRHSADFANVKAEVKTQDASAAITRETADTVAQDQAEVAARAQADQENIRARIDANPRAAGPADADILRVAREAHARALCAASRVQRARCGDDPAAAP